MVENFLGTESSPYLLQHKDNPVDWYPWGEKAFTEALKRDKPLLLSIGYASCHWCHVMAHESFESPDIAILMNELFINIKVDREEMPEVDAIYMNAITLMGQHGGWPLTVFLTPSGEPYWGGTYFPPMPSHGQPGFPDVLRAMSDVYYKQKDKMDQNIGAINNALANASKVPTKSSSGLNSPKQLNEIAINAVRMLDPIRGGISGAPKFPQPSFQFFLWRAYRRTGTEKFKNAVLTSVRNMCQGGIYDHLGGGFARYSTDENWLVPHFEKMLYDNAQLIELMSLLWQETGNPLLKVRVTETIEWCLRDLRQMGGGFAGTMDADSEGIEGKFYVWSEEEIDSLLGDKSKFFKNFYGVTQVGNWDGATILNRSANLSLGSDSDEAILSECRAILLAVRNKRIWPDLDDKILADWNGLMISALAIASQTFGEKLWLGTSIEAYEFIRHEMMSGERLLHSWRQGSSKGNDVLDDYAQMIRASLLLYQITGEEYYLNHSLSWLKQVNDHFWDEDGGGYFFSPEDANHLIARTRNAFDNATPAGNGTMIENLATLYYLNGSETYREKAEMIVDVFARKPSNEYINMTSILNGFERLTKTIQVVIIGEPDAPETSIMKAIVSLSGHLDLVLSVIQPDRKLPSKHPATGKAQIDSLTTAYVCIGHVCGPPITAPEELKRTLSEA